MPNERFQLESEFKPTGDQPQAIDKLVAGYEEGRHYQTLLGVTGSGKTFTMANVIQRLNRPALVLSHNKTLAAQLYEEFKELFPNNAVCYFVSYYDYYQPEAYIPQRDIYIEKDASRNDNLDRLRLQATSNLISRNDVIVVASVSCIFGLGSPESYRNSVISLSVGQRVDRTDLLRSLNDLQYERAEFDFKRGTYRVRGDVVEVYPGDQEFAHRIELFGDEIETLQTVDPLTGELLRDQKQIFIFPRVHYVIQPNQVDAAAASILEELDRQLIKFRSEGKLLEAQRLQARTRYDAELIKEVGVCPGIENYSRHLDGRPAGAKPYTLMDYFPDNGEWVMFIDESHVTIPQLHAMYHGDRHRKETLVDHGFRLPSALDNRPMRFEEIENTWPRLIFVSATPSKYELEKSGGEIVEQLIRPTGLVDPLIDVRPAQGQVPDLLQQVRETTAKGERSLITTLTKRLAEDLASYFDEEGVKCRYMHSDIMTLDRVDILRELREGKFDALIGVNLLREGLDLPEVSLVAILDADKTGFLRSATSMIQQIGRAARNVNSKVILYADTVTPAMAQAMDETNRRRDVQLAYNAEHGITPTTVKRAIRSSIERELRALQTERGAAGWRADQDDDVVVAQVSREELIAEFEREMYEAAQNLNFEKAASLRDRVKELKDSPTITTVSRSGKPKTEYKKPGTPGTRARQKKKHRSS
jgi:excinuclease ABC subunit B